MFLYLARSRGAVAATHAAHANAVSRRTFVATRTAFVTKESTLHNDNRASQTQHHKEDQLRKQREGKGHWKDELASDSESAVKADRGEMKAAKGSIEELQRETAKKAQKEAKGGKK